MEDPASSAIAPSSGRNCRAACAIERLLLGVHRLARCQRGLEAEEVDDDRAAVHAAQQAGALQRGEVPTDGLGSDGEVAGELGDLHPAGGARLVTITACRSSAYIRLPPFTFA